MLCRERASAGAEIEVLSGGSNTEEISWVGRPAGGKVVIKKLQLFFFPSPAFQWSYGGWDGTGGKKKLSRLAGRGGQTEMDHASWFNVTERKPAFLLSVAAQ